MQAIPARQTVPCAIPRASLGDVRSSVGCSRGARGGACYVVGFALVTAACQYDRADRWGEEPKVGTCTTGATRCSGVLERCQGDGVRSQWQVIDDCASKSLLCSSALGKCTRCLPGARFCEGMNIAVCGEDGSSSSIVGACAGSDASVCRDGACVDLCAHAARVRSNIGCEYWAADLDNAVIQTSGNAAAQQYAVVVSNPQPDLPARVTIDQDDSVPGAGSLVRTVVEADISPLNLHVFKLGPREVDGSPDGEFNTGSGTAHTRQAYRIRSQVPVVAYQFNPLDNVGVFSNDASLLKPVEALVDEPGSLLPSYVVVGWPQTIAATDDPLTNFDPVDPIHLRAFVAIVGTRPDTHVRFLPTARIVAGGEIAETAAGSPVEATLQPFDVLNLETGGFQADFTGSVLESDQPVVVFSGNEASDSPAWATLADRSCCADHLEEQLDPIRTAGQSFIAPHGPSRTRAVAEAGGGVAIVDEPEFFRVVAALGDGPTHVITTLPPPDDSFDLLDRGAFRQLAVRKTDRDFMLWTDRPVMLGNIQPSQQASFVRLGLPGGDPSLIIIPPMEQYRSRYVFLTPDKYAFDFITIAAPRDAHILVDGTPLSSWTCSSSPADGLEASERGRADPDHLVHRCQLSFPLVDPNLPYPDNVTPGSQNDGVRRVEADLPVMVVAYGFDLRVSYGYAAGTQLEEIAPAR